jgi:hypothetical protein
MWTAARTFDLETIETNLRILDIARSALDASYLEWTRTVRCEKSPLDTTKSTHLRKKSWTTVAVAGALWEYENGSQELRASGLCVGKESGRLGHPMNDIEYPDVRVELTKTDRNSYAIIGRLRRALRDARVSCRGVLHKATSGDYATTTVNATNLRTLWCLSRFRAARGLINCSALLLV